MSFKSPHEFERDLDALEAVEKASTRFVAQGINDLLGLAAAQFGRAVVGAVQEADAANYVGEDITRMALERIGAPRVPDARLFGAVDYKAATYQFLPEFAVKQALLVDSKAEKGAFNNLRVQVTQTSLEIRQVRSGEDVRVSGRVPRVWETEDDVFLTTTALVKWHYEEEDDRLVLKQATVATLPNGFLQERYNPTCTDGIWNAGPDSPARGEKFRTRLNFTELARRASWRVQRMVPGAAWTFSE